MASCLASQRPSVGESMTVTATRPPSRRVDLLRQRCRRSRSSDAGDEEVDVLLQDDFTFEDFFGGNFESVMVELPRAAGAMTARSSTRPAPQRESVETDDKDANGTPSVSEDDFPPPPAWRMADSASSSWCGSDSSNSLSSSEEILGCSLSHLLLASRVEERRQSADDIRRRSPRPAEQPLDNPTRAPTLSSSPVLSSHIHDNNHSIATTSPKPAAATEAPVVDRYQRFRLEDNDLNSSSRSAQTLSLNVSHSPSVARRANLDDSADAPALGHSPQRRSVSVTTVEVGIQVPDPQQQRPQGEPRNNQRGNDIPPLPFHHPAVHEEELLAALHFFQFPSPGESALAGPLPDGGRVSVSTANRSQSSSSYVAPMPRDDAAAATLLSRRQLTVDLNPLSWPRPSWLRADDGQRVDLSFPLLDNPSFSSSSSSPSLLWSGERSPQFRGEGGGIAGEVAAAALASAASAHRCDSPVAIQEQVPCSTMSRDEEM